MRKRITAAILITISLALHVGLVLRSYRPSVLLKGEIPLKGDVSRYFATAYGASNVEGMFGYDPYFMAGYHVGLWNSMGKKGFEIAHMLLPWLSLPALFYLVLVGVSFAAPLLMWLALRTHCGTRRCAWILFVMTMLFWHLDSQIVYFWDFGNVFFPGMSCMAVALVALAWNTVRIDNAWGSAILAGIVAAAVFYCHTVVLLAAVVPVLCALESCRRKASDLKAWLQPGLALAVFLSLVVWWLVPLLMDRASCLPQPKEWFQAGPKDFVMDVFSDRVYRHHWDRTFLFHMAVVLGIAGIWIGRHDGEERSGVRRILGIGGIAALIITYTFSYVPALAMVQPKRFMIPATLLFLLPASACIDSMIDTVRASTRSVQVVIALLLAVMLPEFSGYLIDRVRPPMSCGMDLDRAAVMDWLRQDKQLKGRVFCDDSELGRLIPYASKMPVIGGLSAQAFVKHRFAGSDDDGIVFGRRSVEWSGDALKRYLDVYAVDAAVLSRPEWLEFAGANADLFAPLQTHGNMTVFRVLNSRPSLVAEGEATVVAEYGSIQVRDVAGADLLLKLHYSDLLEASDGVTLTPEPVLNDPVPFIRCTVPAGVTEFRIECK